MPMLLIQRIAFETVSAQRTTRSEDFPQGHEREDAEE
jgi:hypothetical protein